MTESKNLEIKAKQYPPVFYHESGFTYQVQTQKEILKYLQQYVSGQNAPLSRIAYVAHLYSMKNYHHYMGADVKTLPKINTLITAPTGCGKTHIVKALRDSTNLPYQRIDCSSISAEGWKGTSLSQYLKDYLDKTPTGIGILHLDEFDKLAENGLSHSGNSRQFTFERQAAMLDLLDGSYAALHESRTGQTTDLSNCNNALIVMSGSFQSFREEQETVKTPIGFGRDPEEFKKPVSDWRKELKEHGFIAELANRIMSNAELEPYTRQQIKNIVHNTSNNPHEKFKNLIGEDRASLSDVVLESIIDRVLESESGMRELDALIFDEVFKNDSIS